MTPRKTTWLERLEKWRKEKKEFYAKQLLTEPEKLNLIKGIRFPACYLIMGARRVGKTGLAHEIAHKCHEKLGVSAVLHMPYAPKKVRRRVQAKLPPWMKITVSMSEWPKDCVVIYDEASQSAHARRSQSHDAITLDNLQGVSGQRNQLILFISHHSRKLDPGLVRDIDGIIYKMPTYAHAIFEREELTELTWRAVDFFSKLDKKNFKKHALLLDLWSFTFYRIENKLAPWWDNELSCLFQEIYPEKGDNN